MAKGAEKVRRKEASRKESKRRSPGGVEEYNALSAKAEALERTVTQGTAQGQKLSAHEKALLLTEAADAWQKHYAHDDAARDFKQAGDLYAEAASQTSGRQASRLRREAQKAYTSSREQVRYTIDAGMPRKYTTTLALAAIGSFIGGFALLGPSLTGNAVTSITEGVKNPLGGIFLLLGMLCGMIVLGLGKKAHKKNASKKLVVSKTSRKKK